MCRVHVHCTCRVYASDLPKFSCKKQKNFRTKTGEKTGSEPEKWTFLHPVFRPVFRPVFVRFLNPEQTGEKTGLFLRFRKLLRKLSENRTKFRDFRRKNRTNFPAGGQERHINRMVERHEKKEKLRATAQAYALNSLSRWSSLCCKHKEEELLEIWW